MMRFQGNLKIAAIAALGVMLLAVIAGAIVFALTTVQSTTEDTPAGIVGETAGAAVAPVVAVGEAAPGSPIEPAAASANETSNPPANPSNVSATRDGFTVTGSWDAATGATSYDVELMKSTTSGTTVEQTLTGETGETASFTLATAASFHDSHVVSVTAKNADGDSDAVSSAVVGPPDAPDAPDSVTGARSTDGASIAAEWSEVSGASYYDVRHSSDNGQNWTNSASYLTDTELSLTGLDKKKAYIVAVKTTTQYTQGSIAAILESDWQNSDTIHAPPSAPRGITFMPQERLERSLVSAYAEWEWPEYTGTGSDEAADELSYNVSCRASSTDSWTRVLTETKSPISTYDSKKHKVTVTDASCLSESSEVGISAVNEVEGPIATATLNTMAP